MSVAVWNCHSWPLDVSRNVNCQSRFIFQVLCIGIQGISALVVGGPSARVGSSAKFCVLVCKASLLWYWGVHWQKKVHLPSFVYWYSRHFCSGTGGSIGRRRFICQIWTPGCLGVVITKVFSLRVRPIINNGNNTVLNYNLVRTNGGIST